MQKRDQLVKNLANKNCESCLVEKSLQWVKRMLATTALIFACSSNLDQIYVILNLFFIFKRLFFWAYILLFLDTEYNANTLEKDVCRVFWFFKLPLHFLKAGMLAVRLSPVSKLQKPKLILLVHFPITSGRWNSNKCK